MRAAVPAWAAALLAAGALLLAACGEDDAPKSSTRPAAATDPPALDLEVHVDDGAGHTASGRIICRPGTYAATGDFAPRSSARRLCRDASSLARLLTAKPSRRMCAQRYGGPETARVSGTIEGRTVDRRFGRTNGCAIEEFARLKPILPAVR
ncbi:MAG: hypothetical protein ACRDKY_11065 [Solirubrobacteraceae bacterium]